MVQAARRFGATCVQGRLVVHAAAVKGVGRFRTHGSSGRVAGAERVVVQDAAGCAGHVLSRRAESRQTSRHPAACGTTRDRLTEAIHRGPTPKTRPDAWGSGLWMPMSTGPADMRDDHYPQPVCCAC
jgi:hypothetical protein